MAEIDLVGFAVEPDWYRTSGVGAVHRVTLTSWPGDGHGARYSAACSGCTWGTVSRVIRSDVAASALGHLDEIRNLGAPDDLAGCACTSSSRHVPADDGACECCGIAL